MKLARTSSIICLAVAFGCVPATGLFAADAPAAPAAKPKPKGLVLHYNFDAPEKEGIVYDASGQKNVGKVSGAKQSTAGKKGRGYQFYSVGTSIQAADSPSLNPQQFTLSTWFQVTASSSAWRHILDKGNVALGVGGDSEKGVGKDKLFVSLNGRPLCFSKYVVTDRGWHHAAATFDGSKVTLYLDGRPQEPVVPFKEKIVANQKPLLIGMKQPQAESTAKPTSLGGLVDEVMIFNRPLAAAEIKEVALSIDPAVGKPKYTKKQVLSMYNQLRRLFEDGLINEEFFEKKVRLLEAGLGDEEEAAAAAAAAAAKKKTAATKK